MVSNPAPGCDGCTDCAMRCTDSIRISEYEYTRIVEELRMCDPGRALKVLEQSKELPWFEEISYTACLFLDINTRLCLVYPARPLICRLFGRIPHLPCPTGRQPVDIPDAARILDAYAAQPLHTFQDWMVCHGVFNFEDLLGTPYRPPSIEL